MRVSILLSAAVVCGLIPAIAEARTTRTVVTIAPRYLSAGSIASPGEYRGAVAQADARFQPVTNSVGGRFNEWQQDPWYVPHQRGAWSMDFDGWSGKRNSRR